MGVNILPRETNPTDSMTQQVTALHDDYVVAVNQAVAADDYVRVDRLVREFDRDALELMTKQLRRTAA